MFGKNFKYSLFLMSAYMLMIASVDKGYRDDYYRIVDGHFWWDVDGRPLANLIIYIFNSGGILTDISPRSYIFSALIAALTCAIIGYKIIKSTPLINSLSAALIFFSPFFLQSMVYKFDLITMCISILLCAAPFAYDGKKRHITFFVSFASVLASLSTYQASMPLFLILNFVYIISNNSSKSESIDALIRIFGCFIALIVYKLFIATAFVTSEYGVKHAEVGIPRTKEDLQVLIWSMNVLFGKLNLVYNTKYIIAFLPAIVMSAALFVKVAYTQRNNRFNIVTIVISLIAAASSCFIFFLVKHPAHHVRAMIGFGCATFLLVSLSCAFFRSRSWMSYLVCLPPILLYTSIANDYVVAAKSQFKYEKQIVELMFNDYQKNNGKGPIKVIGVVPFTDETWRIFKKTPIIKEFMNYDLSWWSGKYFAYTEYPIIKKAGVIVDKNMSTAEPLTCDKKVSNYNGAYTTFVENGSVIIVFSKKC